MADSASVLTSKISEKGKLTNSINRTTSESLRLNDSEKPVNSPNSLSSTAPRKKTSFQITSVIVGSRTSNDGGDDSADDLDESHAEDISEVLDNSRITDLENETPSYSEDTFSKDDVFFNASSSLVSAPVIPTSSQYGLAIVATPENSESALNPPDSSGNSDTVDTAGGDVTESVINLGVVSTKHDPEMRDMHPPAPRTERFKVVKIESTEPFKRGRWVCMDYLDHTIAQKEQSQVSSAKIESSECNIQVNLATDIPNSAPSDYTSSVNSVIEVSPLESQVPVPTEHINNCAPLNMQPNDSSQVSSQMPLSSVPSAVPASYPSVSPGQSLQNSMQMGHIINSSAPPPQVSQQSQSLSQVNMQQILGNTSQHQSLQSQQMQQILSGANVMPMQQQQAPIPQTMQQQQPVMQQPMQTMQQMHQTNQQYQPQQQQTMPSQQNIQQQQQTMPQQQAPMPQQQNIQQSIPQQQTIPQQQSLPQQQTLPQQAAVSQSQPTLTQQPSLTQQQALQQQAMQQTLPPQQQTMSQQQAMSQQQPLPQQQSIPPQSQTIPQQQPIPQQPQGIPQQQTLPQPQQQQTMPQQQQSLPQQQQTMPQPQQMPQQQSMPQQQQNLPQQQQNMPQQQQSMPQQQQTMPQQQQTMPQQQQTMAQQQQPMTQQQQTMPQQQPIPQQQFQTIQQPQQAMMQQQMPQQTLQTQMPVQQVQLQPGVQQMPIQQPQNQQQQMMQQSLQQMQQQPSQMHQVPYSQAMQQTQQPVMTQASGQQQVPGMLPQMHPQMGYQTNQMMPGMQPQPIMNIQSQPHLQPQYYQTTQQMPTGIITSQPGMMTQGGMTQVSMQGSTPNLPPLQTYPTSSVPQPMQVQGMPQTPPIPTSVQYTMPHLSQTNQPLSMPMSMQQPMAMPQPQPTPQQQPPLQQPPPQPAQSYAGVSSPAQSYTHGMSSSSVPSALMMEHPLLNGEHPENPTAALIESLNEVTAPGEEPGEDAESTSGANAVAIDNKIEQAMDLVKSHLMYAVREEVEVLKEKIAELMERIGQLEAENATLRAGATPETLAMLPPPSQTTTTNP